MQLRDDIDWFVYLQVNDITNAIIDSTNSETQKIIQEKDNYIAQLTCKLHTNSEL